MRRIAVPALAVAIALGLPMLASPAVDPQADPGAPVAAAAPESFTTAETLDDLFSRVAALAPAFGGMFYGPNEETLEIYLTQTSPLDAARAATAITLVFGPGTIPAGGIRVRDAEHRFEELRGWYRRLVGPALSTPGVAATDIGEAANRLVVAVEGVSAVARVRELVARLAIPPDAVATVVTGPFAPLATIQDSHTPRQGGYRLTRLINNQPGFGITGCTLGFNAIRLGVDGFVTNSHCTQVFWSPDTAAGYPPADFYQAPFYVPAQLVATETVDPPGFSCAPPYPATHRCRYSDSAFATYVPSASVDQGRIGVPVGLTTTITNPGPPVLTVGNSTFDLASRPTQPYLVGLRLDKIGSSSGWTRGSIEYAFYPSTCADFVDSASPPRVRLCQYVVGNQADSDPTNDNWQIATFGDSGAPVFRRAPGGFQLYGILWGGSDFTGVPSAARKFVFSPIGGVKLQKSGVRSQTDLGALSYCVPTASPPC